MNQDKPIQNELLSTPVIVIFITVAVMLTAPIFMPFCIILTRHELKRIDTGKADPKYRSHVDLCSKISIGVSIIIWLIIMGFVLFYGALMMLPLFLS